MFLELNCDDFIEVQEKKKKVVFLSFWPPHNRNVKLGILTSKLCHGGKEMYTYKKACKYLFVVLCSYSSFSSFFEYEV